MKARIEPDRRDTIIQYKWSLNPPRLPTGKDHHPACPCSSLNKKRTTTLIIIIIIIIIITACRESPAHPLKIASTSKSNPHIDQRWQHEHGNKHGLCRIRTRMGHE
jgi:hypothetical protein